MGAAAPGVGAAAPGAGAPGFAPPVALAPRPNKPSAASAASGTPCAIAPAAGRPCSAKKSPTGTPTYLFAYSNGAPSALRIFLLSSLSASGWYDQYSCTFFA